MDPQRRILPPGETAADTVTPDEPKAAELDLPDRAGPAAGHIEDRRGGRGYHKIVHDSVCQD